MKKIILGALFLFIAHNQVFSQKDDIKNTINTFFEGLHNGDTTLVNKVVSKKLQLQTVIENAIGEIRLLETSKSQFLKMISSKKPTDKWFEKIQSFEIRIDENLASVWTPYKFYLNDNFSHCGVNSFQLFNNNGTWEIIYIIDTRRKEMCKN
jgi:hypothetical protein